MDNVRGDDNFIDCNENESFGILKGIAAFILVIILLISFNELLPSLAAMIKNNTIESYLYNYTIYSGYGYKYYFVYVVMTLLICSIGLFLNKKNYVFYTFFILVVLLNVYSFSS